MIAVPSEFQSYFLPSVMTPDVRGHTQLFAASNLPPLAASTPQSSVAVSEAQQKLEAWASPDVSWPKSSIDVSLPSSSEPSNTQYEEHVAICDNCNHSVGRNRFKCVQCPDYDLCSTCMHDFGLSYLSGAQSAAAIHNPQHLFVHLIRPLPPVSARVVRFPVLHWAEPVFRTTAVHLHTGSHTNAITQMHHDHHHGSGDSQQHDSLVSCPTARSLSDVEHEGYICDNCERPLLGIRYKCANCADYGTFAVQFRVFAVSIIFVLDCV